jgi:hypothetical protein
VESLVPRHRVPLKHVAYVRMSVESHECGACLHRRLEPRSGSVRCPLKWVVLALLLVAGVAASDEPAIVVLHRPGLEAEENAVLQTLRIYTGQLGYRVIAGGAAPDSLSQEALAQVAAEARAEDAVVIVWVEPEGDALRLRLLRADTLDLREIDVESDDPDGAARAAALKVRSFVVDLQLHARVAATQPASGPASRPSGTGPLPDLPAAATAERRARKTAPPRASRVRLGAGYGVSIPDDSSWLRQGVSLGASLALGRIEIGIGCAINGPPAHAFRGFEVSLADVPFAVDARLLLRRGSFRLSFGPRAGLHLFGVRATTLDGQASSLWEASAALGAAGVADFAVWRDLGLQLGLSFEVLLPAREFKVLDENALRTGPFVVGLTAALTYGLL